MKPPFDPILIPFGQQGLGIHWYGILIFTGILMGAIYAARQAKLDGEDPEHVWNMLAVAVLLGVVGARVYHVFSEPEGGMAGWSYYRENPLEALFVWKGGLGIYGAVAGGALGIFVYTWRAKLQPLQWLDYAAPGLVLGQAIGRWGNFINQELYGPPTDLPWGLIIDAEHRITPYNDPVAYPPDTLFHPTFLYESLWCLVVFITLALVASRLKDRLLPGDVVLGYLMGYPLGRFFIEYIRPDAWIIGPLAAAQWFAIGCVVAGAAGLTVRHLRARAATPLAAAVGEPADTDAPQNEEAGE